MTILMKIFGWGHQYNLFLFIKIRDCKNKAKELLTQNNKSSILSKDKFKLGKTSKLKFIPPLQSIENNPSKIISIVTYCIDSRKPTI